jgi:hypothetical protein
LNKMFNLEQAISEWRGQMLAAGLGDARVLDELEGHLREEIERQVKSGLTAHEAFDISVALIGQARPLQKEFKRSGPISDKAIGILAALIGMVILIRILAVHHRLGSEWKMDQLGWLVPGLALLLLGLGTVVFDFQLGPTRTIRLWKLIGVSYSFFAVCLSILPAVRLATKFGAIFHLTDWMLMGAAIGVSSLSVSAWRHGSKLFPAMTPRSRTTVGVAGCLLGPICIALFIGFAVPHLGHVPAPRFFALIPWAWTLVAVLGGIGYGLTEAARRQIQPTTA